MKDVRYWRRVRDYRASRALFGEVESRERPARGTSVTGATSHGIAFRRQFEDDLEEWLRFIKAESHILKDHPRMFFQQTANQPDELEASLKWWLLQTPERTLRQ